MEVTDHRGRRQGGRCSLTHVACWLTPHHRRHHHRHGCEACTVARPSTCTLHAIPTLESTSNGEMQMTPGSTALSPGFPATPPCPSLPSRECTSSRPLRTSYCRTTTCRRRDLVSHLPMSWWVTTATQQPTTPPPAGPIPDRTAGGFWSLLSFVPSLGVRRFPACNRTTRTHHLRNRRLPDRPGSPIPCWCCCCPARAGWLRFLRGRSV